MFKIYNTTLVGVFEIKPVVRLDIRGHFVKFFTKCWFQNNDLESEFVEQYYSVSTKNVLRGLHFQRPPHDHYKLVTCFDGDVFDVVLDLRSNSPTYGQHAIFELSSSESNSLYIPKGLAHGFYVRSLSATMFYNVSTEYQPLSEGGVRWNSSGILWPCDEPLISKRDSCLPGLIDIGKPFPHL